MADQGLRRRDVLTGGIAAAGGAAAATVAWVGSGAATTRPTTDAAPAGAVGEASVPFHGVHQAGVTTPAPALTTVTAFDLLPGTDREALARLLQILTDDAARLTAGQPALADTEPELAESPARLTVTMGFGPGLFDAAGLASQRPAWLSPLPAFDIDALEERWSGGDLLIHLACDDPTTLAHAARMTGKSARAFTTVRWIQRGFRHAAGVRPDQTPRNPMGQIDGTVNPRSADDVDRLVWAGAQAPDWLRGGTGLVVRRIRMDLDTWDELDRSGREAVIGRRLSDGAPLTGGRESDDVDLAAVGDSGLPVIGAFAHVRRARGGVAGPQFLRRSWTYDDGPGDVGQIFMAYTPDPVASFLPVQRRLAEADLLNEWTVPVGSAVFALPRGCDRGDWIGSGLLGAA